MRSISAPGQKARLQLCPLRCASPRAASPTSTRLSHVCHLSYGRDVENSAHHLYLASMKKIGFLSFGHWTLSTQSRPRSAAGTITQSIEVAVAAEELGADAAYFRVHHFARQLASRLPLLSAAGA